MAVTRIGAVLVQPDDPKFAERDIEPSEALLDIDSTQAESMLGQWRKAQANYTTAPFDPEGRFLRFFPGGFTIWSGSPGNGKTTALRQLVCHLLRGTTDEWPPVGPGVFVCSLEEM